MYNLLHVMPEDAGLVKMLPFPSRSEVQGCFHCVTLCAPHCVSWWMLLTLGPWNGRVAQGLILVPGDGPEEDDPACAFPRK